MRDLDILLQNFNEFFLQDERWSAPLNFVRLGLNSPVFLSSAVLVILLSDDMLTDLSFD